MSQFVLDQFSRSRKIQHIFQFFDFRSVFGLISINKTFEGFVILWRSFFTSPKKIFLFRIKINIKILNFHFLINNISLFFNKFGFPFGIARKNIDTVQSETKGKVILFFVRFHSKVNVFNINLQIVNYFLNQIPKITFVLRFFILKL